MLPKRVFIRAPQHLARLTQECWCSVPGCVGKPIHAHHDRRDGRGGTGIKPSDTHCVPFCYWHHDMIHKRGTRYVEELYGLDLRVIAAWQAFLSKQLGLIK